jgi:hypothetical protein
VRSDCPSRVGLLDQQLAPPRPIASPGLRLGLVAAFALVAAVAAWALLTRQSASVPSSHAPATISAGGPRIVTIDGLSALAGLRGSPVYWAGARPTALYEVSETANGFVYVRYLPSGTAPGDPRPAFLTIGTYPRPDAYGDVRAAAQRPGAVSFRLARHGLAVYDENDPTSIYLAYPGSKEQVEVYDPSPAVALRIARSGRVRPVP